MFERQVPGGSGVAFGSRRAESAPVSRGLGRQLAVNAWQHRQALPRSRQGTSSPSQLLLEEDTWTNLRKRALGHRADTARLFPPLLILVPGEWVLPHYSSLMFLSCQHPLTATSVKASEENCIHPISSKFLFLPYLQALSNCNSFLLTTGSVWVQIREVIKHLSPNGAEYSPYVSFSDGSVTSLSDTRQLSAPYRQVVFISHLPHFNDLYVRVFFIAKLVAFSHSFTAVSFQEKLRRYLPFTRSSTMF